MIDALLVEIISLDWFNPDLQCKNRSRSTASYSRGWIASIVSCARQPSIMQYILDHPELLLDCPVQHHFAPYPIFSLKTNTIKLKFLVNINAFPKQRIIKINGTYHWHRVKQNLRIGFAEQFGLSVPSCSLNKQTFHKYT